VLEDDLSEELTDPGMTPPGLRMPSPSMMSGDPTEFADARRIDEEATELLTVEDMDTDPMIQRRNTW
jgi:hypothetical protein